MRPLLKEIETEILQNLGCTFSFASAELQMRGVPAQYRIFKKICLYEKLEQDLGRGLVWEYSLLDRWASVGDGRLCAEEALIDEALAAAIEELESTGESASETSDANP